MSIIEAIKQDGYQIGNCRMIQYSRNDQSVLKAGFLGELYFALTQNRYSKRSGMGTLESLFCGMQDLSYDAIVSYLAGRAVSVLGVQDGDNFQMAGFFFPTVIMGAGTDRSCFGAYGFLPRWWGSEEQEVLTAIGLAALFSELNLLSVLGVRYSDNELTAKFMSRFGFRDCGTLPHYLAKRGKLVSATVSELSRDRFEGVLTEMLGGSGSGQQDHMDEREHLEAP